MSNPVFENSAVFGDPRKAKVQARAKAQAEAQTQQSTAISGTATVGYDAASLNSLYNAPSATTADTGRLTYDDVIMKTSGLLAVLVVVAALTWQLAPGLWVFGAVVGLVLGLVNSFKRSPSPALILAYAAAEGVFLGGISQLFQNYDFKVGGAYVSAQPIVLQAILATMATFGAALFLFRSGKVRVTPKFTRWLIVAMVGYLGFSLLNVVLSFFIPSGGFGPLRSGFVGILVGLVAVGLAAASLIVDFDSIKRGVEQGVPAKFAWSAAFGLVVTLVWLYLEFLRLFAMSRN